MTPCERVTQLLNTPPPPGQSLEWLAEQFLGVVAGSPPGVVAEVVPRDPGNTDWWVRVAEGGEVRYAEGPTPRRLFRVLAARLAVKAAEESGGEADVYGGRLLFRPTADRGPVEVEFENTSRAQRLVAAAARPAELPTRPPAAAGAVTPGVRPAGG